MYSAIIIKNAIKSNMKLDYNGSEVCFVIISLQVRIISMMNPRFTLTKKQTPTHDSNS